MPRRSLRILHLDAAGKSVEVEPGAALPPGVRAVVEAHRPIESFDLFDSDSYFFMLAFLWPLAFVGIRAAVRSPRARRGILIPELLLMLGSGWIFYAHSSVGERAWGAAVAFTGLGLYAIAWGLELAAWIRKEV
jgi:hypothetical protein